MDVVSDHLKVVRKQFAVASVLTLFMLVLFYTVFGFYFESSERWVAVVIQGDLTVAPYGIWFTDNHFLQIPVLARLASLFPNIPIYGIWYLALMALYVWLWFFLCIRIIGRQTESMVWTLMLVIPFVGALLGTSLVYAYFMRVSILLTSVSLLLYLDYYLKGKNKPIFILFFLLGCSMRVSSAIMVLGIVTLLAMMCMPSTKRLFKAFWFPWIFASVCMLTILLYKTYSNNNGAKIDQIIEYALLDRGAINPISIATTAEDSIRYRAMTEHALISDSAQISIEFVKRLVDYDKLNLTGINEDDVKHLTEACIPWLAINKWILALLYCVLLVFAYGQRRKYLVQLLLLHIAAWAVILFIGLKINMYSYFIEPWLGVLFGMSYFLLLRNSGERPLFLWQKVLAVVFPVCACINLWPVLHETSLIEKDHNSQAYVNLRYIDKIAETGVPVIWVNLIDFHILPSDIFTRKETKVFQKCEYLCMYFWGYYPFAQERCKERLGFSPLDWPGMNKELHIRKGHVSFMMTEELAVFLHGYYSLLYDMSFELERDVTQPEVLPGVFVYRLL